MIEGGWPFIWASYAAAAASLGVLALIVALRLSHWAKRARELDSNK
jgi:hypothetical protein